MYKYNINTFKILKEYGIRNLNRPSLTKNKTKTNKATLYGIGIDIQLIQELSTHNSIFLNNNFTLKELEYCYSSPDPPSSLTGRWAAKEAAYKALSDVMTHLEKENLLSVQHTSQLLTQWSSIKKASRPFLKNIEILGQKGRSPTVQFHGSLFEFIHHSLFKDLSENGFRVSISHSGEYAIAIAVLF